jgi:glycine oxidase
VGRPADVVVIGAGIIGCAVARELARRGQQVSILDDRPIGAGATQASGGMLAPYSEAADGGLLLDLAIRSLDLYDRFVADVEDDSGMRVGYERSGTLHVARVEESVAALATLHDAIAGRGAASEQLTSDQVRALEPNLAPDVFGGLFIPSQGLVSALDLTCALAEAALRRGARRAESSVVRRVSAHGDLVEIETTNGIVSAQFAVLAAGAWSGQIEIAGAARVPVRPVRGQLLHLGWNGTPLARITWDDRCYLVPWRDGTLLVGATVEDAGFEEGTTVAGVRDLLEAACDLVPHAWTANLLSVRSGLRPAAPDPLPIVGWSAAVPGLMYATGHYRNGILLAPLTAQVVGDAIVSGRRDPASEVMAPGRFGQL